MRRILFIVPEFPPMGGGVSDYSRMLIGELLKTGRYDIEVACPREKPGGDEPATEATLHWLGEANSSALRALLANFPGDVVVQYSGYGYQKRGCPFWLASALGAWKKAKLRARLSTMFHELGGSGPVTSSGFWLAPAQWWIPITIGKLSDTCITNRGAYADILSRATGTESQALPVFSNAGEPETVPSVLQRKKALVIFGSKTWRQRAFVDHKAQIANACAALHLTEVVNIGEASSQIPSQVGNFPVRNTGWMKTNELSALLSESVAGFFSYPVDFLGKSGIFAAYCAHGVVPVGAARNVHAGDGLRRAEHFLLTPMPLGTVDAAMLQRISDNVRAWYRPHSIAAHAKLYDRILSGDGNRAA